MRAYLCIRVLQHSASTALSHVCILTLGISLAWAYPGVPSGSQDLPAIRHPEAPRKTNGTVPSLLPAAHAPAPGKIGSIASDLEILRVSSTPGAWARLASPLVEFGSSLPVGADEPPHSVSRADGPACRVFRDIGHAGKILLLDTKNIYTSPVRLTGRNALWLGGIVAVGATIYVYDQEIYDAFHRSKNHSIYKHIRMLGERIEPIGYMGTTNRYYFGALVVGYVFGIEFLETISAQILESHFIAGGVKNVANALVGRRRPHQDMGPRSFEFNDGTSFPSGHSSNVFQLATILSRNVNYVPFQIAAYSLAATVCFERITSRGHWPSDVYFAAVLGLVVSREVFNLHEDRKATLAPVIYENENDNGAGVVLSLSF